MGKQTYHGSFCHLIKDGKTPMTGFFAKKHLFLKSNNRICSINIVRQIKLMNLKQNGICTYKCLISNTGW
jgi:hypothetical protein